MSEPVAAEAPRRGRKAKSTANSEPAEPSLTGHLLPWLANDLAEHWRRGRIESAGQSPAGASSRKRNLTNKHHRLTAADSGVQAESPNSRANPEQQRRAMWMSQIDSSAAASPRKNPAPPHYTQGESAAGGKDGRPLRPRSRCSKLQPGGTPISERRRSIGPASNRSPRRTDPTKPWQSCSWPPGPKEPTPAGRSDHKLILNRCSKQTNSRV